MLSRPGRPTATNNKLQTSGIVSAHRRSIKHLFSTKEIRLKDSKEGNVLATCKDGFLANQKDIRPQKDESPRLKESWDASPKQPSPKCCSIPTLRQTPEAWNGTDGW